MSFLVPIVFSWMASQKVSFVRDALTASGASSQLQCKGELCLDELMPKRIQCQVYSLANVSVPPPVCTFVLDERVRPGHFQMLCEGHVATNSCRLEYELWRRGEAKEPFTLYASRAVSNADVMTIVGVISAVILLQMSWLCCIEQCCPTHRASRDAAALQANADDERRRRQYFGFLVLFLAFMWGLMYRAEASLVVVNE